MKNENTQAPEQHFDSESIRNYTTGITIATVAAAFIGVGALVYREAEKTIGKRNNFIESLSADDSSDEKAKPEPRATDGSDLRAIKEINQVPTTITIKGIELIKTLAKEPLTR